MPAAYIASIYLGKEELAENHLGSGILLGPRLVLTCEHVVENIAPSTALTVRFHGQEKGLRANVKPGSKDKGFDLALIELKVDAKGAAPGWSDDVAEGHQCQVLAWPLGEYEPVPVSVQGTKRREINLNNTLDHGSSGGAVVRLVGDDLHCVGVARDRKSPISHAIAKSHVERYLAQHGVRLPEAPSPPVPPAARDTRKYFEDLRRDTGEIDLDRLGVPREGGRRPVIDALYIPLRTGGEGSATLEMELKKHRLLALVGEAGSGKTTFLRRIAWELCEGKPRQRTARKRIALPCKGFPMFIRASSLDRYIHETCKGRYDPDDPRWLADYLASMGTGLDRAFFEEMLGREDSMALLDGLDEAADEQRREHIGKLLEKASVRGCRYVVSMRPSAAAEGGVLPHFVRCYVSPLDDEGIEQFLKTWCAWLPQDEKYLGGLRRDVAETDWDVRSNPFMLTALAVVYLQNKRLPHERAELFEEIVKWLIAQAEERWGEPHYKRHFILNCLQRLALDMQGWQGKRIAEVSVNDAAERIKDQFQKGGLDEARTFLVRAREASGVLTLRNGRLAFWHKLFQEFLAARRLVSLDSSVKTKLALNLVYLEEGREMLPLAAVLMKADYDYLPKLFVALIGGALEKPLAEQAHAAGVIGSMLRDLDKTGWHLAPAADGEYQMLLKKAEALFDLELSKGIPLRSRVEAAEALGAAGDRRLRTPDQGDYWVPVAGDGKKIQDFHIGRFPVTVHEYRRYLNAKGKMARQPRGWPEQETFRNWPVTGVSWQEAMDYCSWAAEQSGFAVTLPTEEQWEWAAAGHEGREYPWGDKEPTREHANYRETGIRSGATPVGLFPAGNTPGKEPIYDLAGNVLEWTRTVYGAKKDGRGVRGGSFDFIARALRAAYRLVNGAGNRNRVVGFRCIRE